MLRKQKILINKLKRHGTLPPEDTYAVSEQDMQQTYSQKFTSQSVESLRKEYPNLTDKDIETLRNIKKEKDPDQLCDVKAKIQKYEPWDDMKDSLDELVGDMPEHNRVILLEMNKAHEASAFLSTTITQLKKLPSTPTEVFNIADGFVRRIIKVAKQLNFFRAIDKDDQIAMLKGSVVEIMMLRSAVNFDVKTETWNLSTLDCLKSDGKGQGPGGMPAGLDIQALRKAAMAGADLNTLRNIAMGKVSSPDSSGDSRGTDVPQDMKDKFIAMRKMSEGGGGMDMHEDMRKKYMAMGKINCDSGVMDTQDIRQKYLAMEKMRESGVRMETPGNAMDHGPASEANLEHLRNIAKHSGINVDVLRKAAMSGASFSQLSEMARGQMKMDSSSPMDLSRGDVSSLDQRPPISPDSSCPQPSTSSSSISAEILKTGNAETKSMFLTYSKFIRSLMTTIYGDLILLKFLIMLSLFSPDRPGIENRERVEMYQQKYALSMQDYISIRFPEEKNMFARCIMKLTDLRNVNEIHTKMLLKMNVDEIEPLLAEIFDLPQ